MATHSKKGDTEDNSASKGADLLFACFYGKNDEVRKILKASPTVVEYARAAGLEINL